MNEQQNAEGQTPVSASAGTDKHREKTSAPFAPLTQLQLSALYNIGRAANWIAERGHDVWYWTCRRMMEINDGR